jgi:hypothetical protein
MTDSSLIPETPILSMLYADTKAAPQPPRDYRPRRIGQLGLGLFEFIHTILRENELLPQEQRKTVQDTCEIINQQFNLTKDDPHYWTGTRLCTRRHEYNRGKLVGKFGKPYLLSLRYNEDHYPVGSRNFKKPSSLPEFRALCVKNKVADPRFLTLVEIERLRHMQERKANVEGWHIPPEDVVAQHPFLSIELGDKSNNTRFAKIF